MRVEDLDRTILAERRKSERVECSLTANIYIGTTKMFRCLVKDISQSGARILLPSGSWEPNTMGLFLIESETKIQARKIWSSHGMMGIEFERSPNKLKE